MFKKYWPVIVLSLVTLTLYLPLVRAYFQLDEWGAIGYGMGRSVGEFFLPNNSGWAPVTNLITYSLAHTFTGSAVPWALLAIFLQLTNVLLFYGLLKKLTESRQLAFLAAALFAVMPVGNQMIRHFSMAPVMPGITFMLLAGYGLVDRRYWLSIVAIILSFLSGQYGIALVLPILSLIIYLWIDRRSDWRFLLSVATTMIGGLVAVALYQSHLGVVPQTELQQSSGSMPNRLIGIGQFLSLATFSAIGQLFAPHDANIVAQPFIHAGAILVSSAAIGVGLLWLAKQRKMALLFLLSLCWLIGGYLYFAFLRHPALDAAVPSRYLYCSGMGLVMGIAVIMEIIRNYRAALYELALAGAIVLAIVWSYQSYQLVQADIALGEARRQIVQEITRQYSKVPSKVLFLITSDSGHYGLSAIDFPLDFQANFGYVLSDFYYQPNELFQTIANDPTIFFNGAYQWYLEKDGRGFGYVADIGRAKKLMAENNLTPEAIIAFHYTNKTGQVTDLTQRTREVLQEAERPRMALDKSGWTVTVKGGVGDSADKPQYVSDNNFQTSVPIEQNKGNYIQLDLGREEGDLSKIVFTPGDGNGYPRFYQVDVSSDGQKWQTVVASEKAASASQTDIVFRPVTARYIRITNTNIESQFFLWSIAEISLYRIAK